MSQPRRPRVSLIAAVAANGVIGDNNALPWRLPEDLRRFKALTLGHPVIMGRKTFESIGRPLPGRRNIVISRNREYAAAGCEVAASLEAALEACRNGSDEVFIIGGAQIYAEALPLAQRLYMTEVHCAFEGDAHFPAFDRREWNEIQREPCISENGMNCDFLIYERIGAAALDGLP